MDSLGTDGQHAADNLMPDQGLLALLPVSVIIFAADRLLYANPAALRLMEADRDEDLTGRRVTDFIHPLDQPRVIARIRRAEQHDNVTNPPTEFRVRTCRGNLRVLAMTSTSYRVNGENGLLAAFLDMTARSAMERQLRENDENFQRLMHNMQDVYYRTDADGITRYVCPAVKDILGYADHEIIGRPAADFYPDPSDRDELKQVILRDGAVRDFPGQMRHRDGRILDISISSHMLRDEQGQFAGVEGIWRDITERKQLERELEQRATLDDLTRVANRRVILEQLGLALRRFQRNRQPLSLFILDLDYFKRINDRHGHVAGDRALQHFVGVVRRQLREIDQIGRLGGEEFLLLLEGAGRDQAHEIAERIRQTVAQTLFDASGDDVLQLTVSIGAAQAEADDHDSIRLLERADQALYRAKESGRDCISW